MGSGALLLSSTGKRLVRPGGARLLSNGTADPCSCCRAACPCKSSRACSYFLANKTPTTFRVTVAGLTPACLGWDNVVQAAFKPANLDVVAVLEQDALEACLWTGSLAGQLGAWAGYNGASCDEDYRLAAEDLIVLDEWMDILVSGVPAMVMIAGQARLRANLGISGWQEGNVVLFSGPIDGHCSNQVVSMLNGGSAETGTGLVVPCPA